ncbi:hypothetical protein CCR75_006442 [Bremia lactucae]|uniref:Uncharacterized protein n=1 Tax=Bremia lactucae TaxID=4779 RepID=A0A976FK34_BRELC|nr:hypothetical protein CCR75_006442 [Bremia lactucae]
MAYVVGEAKANAFLMEKHLKFDAMIVTLEVVIWTLKIDLNKWWIAIAKNFPSSKFSVVKRSVSWCRIR